MKTTTAALIAIIGLVLLVMAFAVIYTIQSKPQQNSNLVSCGDGICQQETICQGISCLQEETHETCPQDCTSEESPTGSPIPESGTEQ